MARRVCEPIDACPCVGRAGAADAGILRRPLLRVGREDQTLPLTLTLTPTLNRTRAPALTLARWDEKITTFPGLYALGAGAAWLVSLAGGGGGGASAGCTLPVLRAVNLLPALATPPLLLALLRRLHPEAAPADLLGNALLLVRVRVRPNPNPNPNPKP